VAALREIVTRMLGVADAVPCASGSLALEIALRACGVGPGDEVLLPTFCCSRVVGPVLAVGARPVLADVGEELNLTPESVEAALTRKTRAVVVPHLFGNPAEVPAIAALASRRGIRVIDDAAQALGARIDGRPAGSFGDAGILSFGSEKVSGGIGGGVALFAREELLASARVQLAPPRLSSALAGLLGTLGRRLPARLARIFERNPRWEPRPYRKERMSAIAARIALGLIGRLSEDIAARRVRVRAYRDLLAGVEGLALVNHRCGSACLTQVVRVVSRGDGDDAAARVLEAVRGAGYRAQGSYIPLHLLMRRYLRAGRRFPRADAVWEHLVELPCDPRLRLGDIERIASIVRRALEGARS
jgi:dTDP-4-amino-4,6-dideoxygalactose transaminase